MRPAVFLKIALALAAVTLPPCATAAEEERGQARRDFQQARAALRAGDLARYTALRAGLDGYILSGYLDYEYLQDRLAVTPVETVRRFLEEQREAAVGDLLRRQWLRELAVRGRWEPFLAEMRELEDDVELNCYRLGRLLALTPNRAGLMHTLETIWLTGAKLPGACDQPLAAWRHAGYMTAEKVWARIQLAMEKRNLTLAESLARFLDPEERVWVERWLAMHRHPARELASLRYPPDSALARRIVRHGVMRLAHNDPAEAMRRWSELKSRHAFTPEDERYVHRWVGVLAAQNHLPQALEWLAAAAPDDAAAREWRVRAAIRAGDWGTGLKYLDGLNEHEQAQSEWRYWKAYMLERTGSENRARWTYRDLARERSYYGFLAADRLGADYAIQHEAVEASAEEIAALLERRAVQMAQELYAIGDTIAARRQWSWAIRALSNRELQVAAVVAARWGWHDRAILTLGKSDHHSDLELRFPVLYRDLIEANAQQNNLDPDWVYGVLRQESAFMTDARSHAGALGLMQLMPRTGQLTARRIGLPLPGTYAILQVDTNVKLGTSYLRQVLDQYRGHQTLATASYNAGPHRVRQWLPESGALDAPAWVESIPFNETRNYVKNVMGFTAIYGQRLKGLFTRLRERMPEVPPASEARVSLAN
jgi:soluble lytic murein transglycosylase